MPARRLLMAGGGGTSLIPTARTYLGLYNGTSDVFDYDIGRATWTHGDAVLTRHGDPVLTRGTAGTWDDDTIVHPSLVWDGTQYVCYYAGHNGTAYQLGRATSADGITWTKDPANPILSGGVTFPDGVAGPFAYFDADANITRIWYAGILSGGDTRVGYAERSSAGTVTNHGEVLGPGVAGSFDDEGVGVGCVVKSGPTWYLYYPGQSGTVDPDHRTGYATFTDPTGTYTKGGVLAAFSGQLVIGGFTYRSNLLRTLLPYGDGYVGWGTLFHPTDGTGAERSFHVTATDLTTFVAPTGPVITQTPGAWDDLAAENPSLMEA